MRSHLMGYEKLQKYGPEDALPIPTYDESQEAFRPSSSQSYLGPSEISHDAERQGLLGGGVAQNAGSRNATVESARSSLDFSLSDENSPRGSTEDLRRELSQMEVDEPGSDTNVRGNTFRSNRFSKHFTGLTKSLSSINLPLRQWLPSHDYIKARIPVILQSFKPNWIIVGRLFALLLVLFLVYLLFLSDIFKVGSRKGTASTVFYPDSVRAYLRDQINETIIRNHLEYVTLFPSVGGTEGGFAVAEYIQSLFLENELEEVRLEQFDVYLNYPKEGGRRVSIVEPQSLTWDAKIEEETNLYPVFHGLSKSGTVKGHLVYANYGSREDFNKLENHGISVNGSIALVRYYGSQGDRAFKVKAAELAGAIGCIIYSDPADDGFLRGKPYPDGRFNPQDGVQRGTVGLTSFVAGDVLSSGFASAPGEPKRDSKADSRGLNRIPSIPLAWRDAQRLLQALKGHGMKVDGGWVGGVPDVSEWWSGDSDSPIVELANEQEEIERRPIYNVLGKITGVEQSEKSIIIGSECSL